VDAVANTLYGIADEVTVEVLAEPADRTRNLTREQLDRLIDVFDGEEYTARLGEVEIFAREEEARTLILPPGQYDQLRWETLKLIEASARCIVAVGYYDLSGTASEDVEPVLHALSLSPRRGTEEFNPTPWLVVDSLANRSGGEVNPDSVMLEADLATFGDALTHSCEVG
jgi:hypothetical protein